jgi:hypothetical protein
VTSHQDRGRDVSQELTEVRTVLSRAESALQRIQHYRSEPREVDPRYGGNEGFDPDGEDMLRELSAVVIRLSRWRKTGSTRRRV